MTTQKEIEQIWTRDYRIDACASWYILRSANLKVRRFRYKSSVMSFLHDNVRYRWTISFAQLLTRIEYILHFLVEYFEKFAFRYAIAIDDNVHRLYLSVL
jgi:hypothetical protein